MYDQYTWVFALSVIVAFFAAFGIGANDVVSSPLPPEPDSAQMPGTMSGAYLLLLGQIASCIIRALFSQFGFPCTGQLIRVFRWGQGSHGTLFDLRNCVTYDERSASPAHMSAAIPVDAVTFMLRSQLSPARRALRRNVGLEPSRRWSRLSWWRLSVSSWGLPCLELASQVIYMSHR